MDNRVPFISRNQVKLGVNFKALTYVFVGRVLDLGNLSAFTVPDLSPEKNNATLYTGMYADLAVADYIKIDTPNFSSTPTSIDFKARSVSATSVPINWGGLALSGSIPANSLWNAATAEFPADVLANTDKIWFDGVDDYVELTGMSAADSFYLKECTISSDVYLADSSVIQSLWAIGFSSYRIYVIAGIYYINSTSTGVSVPLGRHNVSVDFNSTGQGIALRIDGVEAWTGTIAAGIGGTSFYLGARLSGGTVGLFVKGIMDNFSVTGSPIKNWAWSGTELVTWTDINGVPANNGTVNGTPQTVEQLLRNPSSITVGESTVVDLSNLQIKDAVGALIDEFWLADSVGTYNDGAPCISRGGLIGQYKGAVVGGSAEGVSEDVRNLSTMPDNRMWFDGVDDAITGTLTINSATDAYIEVDTYITDISPSEFNRIFAQGTADGNNFSLIINTSGRILVAVGGNGSGVQLFTSTDPITLGFHTIRATFSGGNFVTILVDGEPFDSGSITATTLSTSSLAFSIGSVANLASQFFPGLIYNLDVNNQLAFDGTIEDGNTIGTVNGDPVTVGQKRATILQTAGEDFNNLMFFDGTTVRVDLPSQAATIDPSTEITASLKFIWSGKPTGIKGLFSNGSTVTTDAFNIFINTSSLTTRIGNGGSYCSVATPITEGQEYSLTFTARIIGGSIEVYLYLNGSLIGSNSLATADTDFSFLEDLWEIGNTNNDSSRYHSGLIYDLAFYSEYTADGDTTGLTAILTFDGTEADGNTVGTVNGSPSNYIIPESSTTAGTDALSNPLDFTRPNERVFNGAVTNSYLFVADSDTRNSLNVFGGWLFYDGTDKVWADYSDGAGTKVIEIVSGAIVATDFTGSDVYIGNTTTEMANTNTLTEGWNYVFVPFDGYSPIANTRFYGRIGHLIEYTEIKTLAQSEQNRKATKNQY